MDSRESGCGNGFPHQRVTPPPARGGAGRLVGGGGTRYKIRMFQQLGNAIGRRAGWLVLAWVGLSVAAGVWTWRAAPVPATDMSAVLPANDPWTLALQRMRKAFPLLNSRSQVVVISYRPSGLQPADIEWLGRVGERVEKELGFSVLSPTIPFLRHRLISADDEAAMLVVNLPTSFLSAASAESTGNIERVTHQVPAPAGLVTEFTGTAAIGRDYGAATQEALHRTTWVTVGAVLLILVLVYRSPFGALVPLVSIGVSVFIAFVLLAMLAA